MNPTNFDDAAALESMASNKALKSYGELNKEKQLILDAYQIYLDNEGSGLGYNKPNVSDKLNQHMLDHYNSSPSIVRNTIDFIRNSLSPDVCPMCGNLGSGGQIDHIFPKSNFQEFAIFTKNLVPACKCNNLRGSAFIGNGRERVLHPYFDDILQERLLIAKFLNGQGMLAADTQVAGLNIIDQNDEIMEAVNFHVEKIVKKTAILDSIRKTYAQFLRKPDVFIIGILDRPIDIDAFVVHIEQLINNSDEEHGSLNNWKSILFAGILDDRELMIKLVEHINGLISNSIDPKSV